MGVTSLEELSDYNEINNSIGAVVDEIKNKEEEDNLEKESDIEILD
jgi:hypothetical protein